jgi:hypothetical protein
MKWRQSRVLAGGLPHDTPTNLNDRSRFNWNLRVLLSYRFLRRLNDFAILSYAIRVH